MQWLLSNDGEEPPVSVPGAGDDRAERWMLYRAAVLRLCGWLPMAQDWDDLERALEYGEHRIFSVGAATAADVERMIRHIDGERKIACWILAAPWN